MKQSEITLVHDVFMIVDKKVLDTHMKKKYGKKHMVHDIEVQNRVDEEYQKYVKHKGGLPLFCSRAAMMEEIIAGKYTAPDFPLSEINEDVILLEGLLAGYDTADFFNQSEASDKVTVARMKIFWPENIEQSAQEGLEMRCGQIAMGLGIDTGLVTFVTHLAGVEDAPWILINTSLIDGKWLNTVLEYKKTTHINYIEQGFDIVRCARDGYYITDNHVSHYGREYHIRKVSEPS